MNTAAIAQIVKQAGALSEDDRLLLIERLAATIRRDHRGPRAQATQHEERTSLRAWIGALEKSPSFSGDPVALQREMRDEWE
jgi:hypothetical protein